MAKILAHKVWMCNQCKAIIADKEYMFTHLHEHGYRICEGHAEVIVLPDKDE